MRGEVEAEVVGDHEELIRGRELDVAPGVREELRELGLFDVEMDDRRCDGTEERFGALHTRLGAGGHDLRKGPELFERLAFGDPLGAEGHVDVAARRRDQLLDHRGDARVHGAAQDDVLAVAELVEQPLHRAPHELRVGVEVLVDRGAHDEHDVLGFRHRVGVDRGVEEIRRDHPLEHRVGVALPERHLARAHRVDRVRVEVVERDGDTGIGEHETERESHVAATADDDNISRKRRAHFGPFPRRPNLTLREMCDLTSGFRY